MGRNKKKVWLDYRREGKERRRLEDKHDKEKPVKTYSQRNEILSRLGYDSYIKYLQSELWQSIKTRVYQLKGTNCCLCQKTATAIHHNSYNEQTLTGYIITQLFPICKGCHYIIEHKEDGTKRTRFMDVKIAFNIMYGKARKSRNRKPR